MTSQGSPGDRRWFINSNGEIRWVKKIIRRNIEYDTATHHLVVSMDNNLNAPTGPNDCKIESINVRGFFVSQRAAQIEIILRERFGKGNVSRS